MTVPFLVPSRHLGSANTEALGTYKFSVPAESGKAIALRQEAACQNRGNSIATEP